MPSPINSPSNSVSPGEYISVYGTGVGLAYDSPPDGTPAPPGPLAIAAGGGDAWFDFVLHGEASSSFWAGRAPGLIGVDQFNLAVPPGVREGCAVPLQIAGQGGLSQPVSISVRSGGGPCSDPAPVRLRAAHVGENGHDRADLYQ